MPIPRTRAIPAVLAATLVSPAVGCGAAEPHSDPDDSVRSASQATVRAGTARFEVRFAGPEGEDMSNGSCDGRVGYTARRLRMLCAFRAHDATYELEMITIEDTDYVRFEGGELGPPRDADKPWIRSEIPSESGELFRFFDPVALLDVLQSASRTAAHLGSADVRGVATEHFRLTVDRDEAKLLSDSEEGPATFPVEVWIGDGLIRRLQMDESGVTTTIEFFDFGVPVNIEPPPQSKVFDIDQEE